MKSKSASLDITKIHKVLEKEFARHRMPVVDIIELQTKDPFKVLVTTILSARTKDETTTAAARRLFSSAGTIADLDKIPLSRIEKLIFPVGFYRTKARMLKQLPGELNRLYKGIIPDSVDELVKLPGVGRKTANLVVAVAFRKPAICVDVHVHRICNRLGYVKTRTPFETEMRLRQVLPKSLWLTINSYLVSFGQHTCLPVNPRCDRCPIIRWCRRINVVTSHGVSTYPQGYGVSTYPQGYGVSTYPQGYGVSTYPQGYGVSTKAGLRTRDQL
jgi:endonuclease III